MAELYTIYQNKTAVDESLSKAGGSTFASFYWSCCQDSSEDYCARFLDFNDGDMLYYGKGYNYPYVCSVRAFN